MSKSNTAETSLLQLLYNNTAFANIGNAGGLLPSSLAGNFYVALHTADPGEAGDQTTSEAAYTGYARVAVPRSTAGWTVSGNQVVNFAAIAFPQCTAGTSTVQFWSVGVASAGASVIIHRGNLGTTPLAFTATTADVITVPGHALAVNDTCVFFARPGTSLPVGITEGTVYFVKTVSSNDITISTTQGGATLDITAAGAGVVGKVVSSAISNTIAPNFAASAITIIEE